MNPKLLPIAALTLLGLVATPAAAECTQHDAGTQDSARTSHRTLGRTPLHRHGTKGQVGQDDHPGVGEDGHGQHRKKRAKRRAKRHKKKVGRHGQHGKKKKGIPPHEG